MKIALLTAGVHADNSGDSVIESSVIRLLRAKEFVRFPLTVPLTEAQINEINLCHVLIITGTNLYQHVFASNLTVEVIKKIKIPIIPFGIGSSAAIGRIPKMNKSGVLAVREIHKRCTMSSVRDEASLKFLHSIGVYNVKLTGCPVLFHGLNCPDFSKNDGEGYTITPRARLLHIDSVWEERQHDTLDLLCKRYHPKIVIQSPYDLSVAEQLSNKYGLQLILDDKWQADIYVEEAKRQAVNMGFRLHFGMLSMSYGKPAFVVAHDSRVWEFYKLMGISPYDIKNYSDNVLTKDIDQCNFPIDVFRKRWEELSVQMNEFIVENGLESNLKTADGLTLKTSNDEKNRSLPRVLLLPDKKGWAFDVSARSIARQLGNKFHFDIKYIADNPSINHEEYDLIYLFFWGEELYKKYKIPHRKIIKGVSSHRWEYDPKFKVRTAPQFCKKYLRDAAGVFCTSLRLKKKLENHHPAVYYTPNGFAASFYNKNIRSGDFKPGWAGNIHDPVKGLKDIILPACEGKFTLITASGATEHDLMNDFYNRIDVFICASLHEGEPLTLLEAMAAGCFPVCTDVGIVSQLIENEKNGIIVKERSFHAFREALEWCNHRLDYVRQQGALNAERMKEIRSWQFTSKYFEAAFEDVIYASRPRFRNDDVSWDTDLDRFKVFCEVFRASGHKQIHGITLHGNTATVYTYDGLPCEYEGNPNISLMNNEEIIKNSEGKRLEDRKDIIDFINNSFDDIALHGLYHTDYSVMSFQEQYDHISEGIKILKRLFPLKTLKYFIPPFNKKNEYTDAICRELGLILLGTEGVHLEESLRSFRLRPGIWYRYHHHRFYPESTFKRYDLDVNKLRTALSSS